MGTTSLQRSSAGLWALIERQHGVVTRAQLVEHGLSENAIKHRLAKGRLHRIWRGVYAAGRPELTMHGRWMAAAMACGAGAALSHESAAALWEIRPRRGGEIEVSVPQRVVRHRKGITVRRRAWLAPEEVTRHHGIPVTTPVCTLVDIAARLDRDRLEAAINEADKRGLVTVPTMRAALEGLTRRPGLALLRETLDRRTFTLTASQLERRFLPIARRAGLGRPETGRYVGGFKVDFFWPDLGLVVETDGLRYYRTPAQQARDRLRDQAHAVAELTSLRFTHGQVRFEPNHVQATLAAVARRLRADQADRSAVGCLGS
jgi:very-short-patch-repair endonuclease